MNYLAFTYGSDRSEREGSLNLGDDIQTIAAEQFMDKTRLIYSDRDSLSTYNGQKVFAIMQGWFAQYRALYDNKIFLPLSSQIIPLYFGFHLSSINGTLKNVSSCFYSQEKIWEKFKQFEPIGCRDNHTVKFLTDNSISAYKSGCLTLSFLLRKINNTENYQHIICADVSVNDMGKIPKKILSSAKFIQHNLSGFKSLVSSIVVRHNLACDVLNVYANAKLVFTSKLHCALPCMAMGVPVIFLPHIGSDERYDALDGIYPEKFANSMMKRLRLDYKIRKSRLRARILDQCCQELFDETQKNVRPTKEKLIQNCIERFSLLTNEQIKYNPLII